MSGQPVLKMQLDMLRDQAKALHERGLLGEALDVHARALELAPDAVGIWLSAARLAYAMNLQEVSLPYFERAASLDPKCHLAVDSARRICIGVGLAERAAHYSKLSYDLNPVEETRISLALVVPSIAQSAAAIRETRQRYERGLDAVLASQAHLEAPQGALGISTFFLAYHGENDRALLSKLARMYLQVIPNLAMTAPHCRGGIRPGRQRIRIGFISRFFFSHSIASTSRGLIEKLSRERFEVWVLRITPSRDDEATARIRAAADHSVDLDADVFRAREQIASLELDILFYQDIGMEQTSYFLAFARLAPLQCVSFGHPNTTGIPTMDYFVSNDLFEPENAQSHYSERLFLLRDLPTLAYYYKPAAEPGGTREDFGFSTGTHLYVCPQTLYKLHPDFDALIAGILARDPAGCVVLIAGQFEEFTAQLRERFARNLAAQARRVMFLPRMPFARFMRLLAVADVILDSVHFNGMNTSLQAFAVGTPVVTLPTGLQRGRHTQAMYRKMQIIDCIATGPQDYIDIAVRIGSDRGYARHLREKILTRNHVLYEDSRVVAEFERFFNTALRG